MRGGKSPHGALDDTQSIGVLLLNLICLLSAPIAKCR